MRALPIAAALCVSFSAVAQGAVIYVDTDAGGLNDGSSWTDACTDLQSALSAVVSGDEIWVAEGAYLPSVESEPGEPRTRTFALVQGVALYGGFSGTETLRNERDWVAHETILSGDIGASGDNSDNSYHVVLGADGAALDGFTVTGGNEDGASATYGCGGGMYNENATGLEVANCVFSESYAWHGGGMWIGLSASVSVANCVFSGNVARVWGGGIANRGSVGVTDSTFSGNSAGQGGGIHDSGSSCTVTGSAFSGNAGGELGGGMCCRSPCTIARCTFTGNRASEGGGIGGRTFLQTVTVTNCTLSGNSADYNGGGIFLEINSAVSVADCAFWGNGAPTGGGICNGAGAAESLTVTNCVLWGNSASWSPGIYGLCTASYSNIQGGEPGTGNIDADPLFADPDGADDMPGTHDDDLRLREGSPCIDAADGDVAPAQDMNGAPRHNDTGTADTGSGAVSGITWADMGAYEFQGTTPAEWCHLLEPRSGVYWIAGTDREIRWATSPGVTDVNIELSRDGGAGWGTLVASTPNDGSHTWTVADGGEPLPQQECMVRASDAADGAPDCSSGQFTIFGGDVYVDADAPGPAHDGHSWTTAFLNPQDAMDASSAGGEIRIAEGTYVRRVWDAVVLTMQDGVAVYGGYAGCGEPDPDGRDAAAHVTTLDGENAARHVVVGASNATLDGFTVTRGNGSAGAGGGMFNMRCEVAVTNCIFSWNEASYGGGMYNYGSSPCPTIVDCVFSGNAATGSGGAISNNLSSPTIANCRFLENRADSRGGAIWNGSGSPAVTNCVLSGNTADTEGGAVRNSNSSAVLTNCTFSGNSTNVSGGAIANSDSTPTVTNCILWGNTAPEGGEIYDDSGSSSTVTHCCVSPGGYAGSISQSTDADPRFVDADGPDDVPGTPDDDLHLMAGSPCIDAADGDVAPTQDMDGNSRVDDKGTPDTGTGTITYADVGAYEFIPEEERRGGGCAHGAGMVLCVLIPCLALGRARPRLREA